MLSFSRDNRRPNEGMSCINAQFHANRKLFFRFAWAAEMVLPVLGSVSAGGEQSHLKFVSPIPGGGAFGHKWARDVGGWASCVRKQRRQRGEGDGCKSSPVDLAASPALLNIQTLRGDTRARLRHGVGQGPRAGRGCRQGSVNGDAIRSRPIPRSSATVPAGRWT